MLIVRRNNVHVRRGRLCHERVHDVFVWWSGRRRLLTTLLIEGEVLVFFFVFASLLLVIMVIGPLFWRAILLFYLFFVCIKKL